MPVEEPPEWLPAGWIVEVRTRKSGLTAGVKDKYYINPSNRRKFRSKDEVLRYLESGKLSKRAYRPKSSKLTSPQKSSKLTSQLKLVPMEDLPKWLPMGWSVEIKTRKKGVALGSTYKCYIDPADGHKFYSRREVFHYIETGKRARRIHRQKKKSLRLLSTDNNPLRGADRQEPINTTARRCLFKSYSLILDGKTAQQFGGIPLEEQSLPLARQCLNQGRDSGMPSCLYVDASMQAKQQFKLDYKKPSESTGGKPSDNEPLLEHECRVLCKHHSTEPDDKHSSQNTLLEPGDKMPVFGMEEMFKLRRTPLARSRKLRAEEEAASCQVSRRLAAGLKPEPAPVPIVLDPTHGPSEVDTATCATEGMKQPLEKHESIKPEFPVTSSTADLWQDPCLEFAFKTLTGAIPVVDDNLAIHDFFQQQLAGAGPVS